MTVGCKSRGCNSHFTFLLQLKCHIIKTPHMTVGFEIQKSDIVSISPKLRRETSKSSIENLVMIPRRTKILDDSMETLILTPNSSVKSSTTMENNPSETRDSFYFPGCRKDTNCNCEICIASINATLDLMPQSVNKSSLTKFSVSRPKIHRSPVNFPSAADFLTPISSHRIRPVSASPPQDSTRFVNFQEKVKKDKKELSCGGFVVRFLVGLILLCGVDYGFSSIVSGGLKSRLSPEMVKSLAENSWVHESLNGRFWFLKNGLEGLVGSRVSRCSSAESVWQVSQDGLLLNSRCVLYESMTEEVSIWGWPLQTAGLLTAEYSSRAFSIISGRVTEWSTGEPNYMVRLANSSWTLEKWSSSVVQFDPNTWILEYRQSFFLENAKPVSAMLEFLKMRLAREFGKMRQEFWMLPAFLRRYPDFTGGSFLTPT